MLPHNPFLSYLQWKRSHHCVNFGFQDSLWLTSNYKFPKNKRYQPNEIGKFIFPKPKRKFMLQNVSQGKIPLVQQFTKALTWVQISAAYFDILYVLSTLCKSLLCTLWFLWKIQKESNIRQLVTLCSKWLALTSVLGFRRMFQKRVKESYAYTNRRQMWISARYILGSQRSFRSHISVLLTNKDSYLTTVEISWLFIY